MIGTFEFPYTVKSSDIDELNHAGNYHYLRWAQDAAVAHSSANGWSPLKYQALESGWVARAHKITYLKPAYECDALTIKTWVSAMKSATSLRHYEIINASGEMLAKVETRWAFINFKTQKPTRIPHKVAKCFKLVEY
ncbi:MAG: acyl-CoA thioesterase [Xanthomonadales bacterium]|nr:acyl-CoA thioesterase [Xanthomonadales bacterium]